MGEALKEDEDGFLTICWIVKMAAIVYVGWVSFGAVACRDVVGRVACYGGLFPVEQRSRQGAYARARAPACVARAPSCWKRRAAEIIPRISFLVHGMDAWHGGSAAAVNNHFFAVAANRRL